MPAESSTLVDARQYVTVHRKARHRAKPRALLGRSFLAVLESQAHSKIGQPLGAFKLRRRVDLPRGWAALYEAPAADSAPALGLDEGNAQGQKSHDGGGQREKGAPRPAEAGRLA